MEMANGRNGNKRQNENNGEAPELEILEKDCKNILSEESSGNQHIPGNEKLSPRIVAMIGLNVVHLRRNSVTKAECDRRHRSRINWNILIPCIIGFGTILAAIAQWINVLD